MDRGTTQPWAGYEHWASHLAQSGRFWEAINSVKILASTMKPAWSIDAYLRIDELLKHAKPSAQSGLCNLALCIALGRRYAAAMNFEKAAYYLEKARTLLKQVEQGLGRTCSRQRLELELANLELLPSDINVSISLQQWHRVAEMAEKRQEWGIESLCLTICAQTAARNRMQHPLMRYLKRLHIVENDLERDIVSVVSNKCGSWLAGARSNLGELLNWFDQHEKQFPVSNFGFGNKPDDNLQLWDIPWSAARVAQLRYLMYSAFQDPERAKAAKQCADHTMKLVPFERVSEMGLLDRYMLEWSNPLSGESVTTFEVLCRRIRNHYSDVTTNDGSHWYRFRDLEPSELRNVVLCLPFNHENFMDRMRSLQQWFATDDNLDTRSSDYLIARLYLDHYAHAKITAQNPQIKGQIVTVISNFLADMPQSSLEVRRQLQGNLLLALQEQYDALLGKPNQPPNSSLPNLRSSYVDLIFQYQSSHLTDNLPAIGSLYGRIAEIDFRLAFSETQLLEATQNLTTSLSYYDDYRTSLSNLEAMAALEIKGYVRQTIVGDQEVLHRVISVLMTKWLQPNIADSTKTAMNSLVWDLVQKNKSRALGDALNAKTVLSAADRATLDVNTTSRKCFECWQSALENLSLATEDRSCQASRLTRLREILHTEERKMLADSICAKIMAFNRGTPPSLIDISKLFAGNKDRVILVDWFTADVPIAPDKLFMLTVTVAPELQSPMIFQLELGIAKRVNDWFQKYIQGADSAKQRQSPASYNDLKSLAGLVQPLAEVSQPGDIIVFCPTTKWMLHRIPLHAIELRSTEKGKDAAKTQRDHLLLLRNRIVYTYSQSLLRVSIVARQSDPSSDAPWRATLLSPLGGHDIIHKMTDLFNFLPKNSSQTTLLTSASVTKTASKQAMLNASFLAFLGHVHPAPRAIKSHMLLYHPQNSTECNASTETDPETTLSGEEIITQTQLQLNAHAVLLACSSGVVEARVQDEALGLVPAFFHAGARSVVATLWDVRISAACEWLEAMQNAWERAERDLKRHDKASSNSSWSRMIDLAEIFRSAAKTILESDSLAGIDSWAPFVYSGYWMYPRVNVDVFDSDEEYE